MPKFSVIMPSCLKDYKHAAKNREEKLVRAIDSVLDQRDFELIVVADGCDRTVEIVTDRFSGEKDIKLFKVSDNRHFGSKRNAGASGFPRNAGIQQASGEYIIYLDIDDIYVDGYLDALKSEMTDHDWYWFDDLSWDVGLGQFNKHGCDVHVQGQCGTSNICHKRDMGAWWSARTTYFHDWMFILTLRAISENYVKLGTTGYGILHVPGLLDA